MAEKTYMLIYKFKTDMDQEEVESFADEVKDEVSANHTFKDEELTLVVAREV